jgi:4-amino-4-deoxy-L-arabinose transferase-like glycosyltransferase
VSLEGARSRSRRLIERLGSASAARWAAALAGLALIVRLPLIFNDFSTSTFSDSGTYTSVADQLLAGHGFVTDLNRTPGYPLLIAALKLLPGPTTTAVVVAQHLLGAALVAAVFLVGDRYFGRLPAVLAALITALAPSMMMVEHAVLPDFLFAIALLAGSVALIEGMSEDGVRLPLLALAGAAFGVAALIKPNGQALVVVAPLALLFITRSWYRAWRGILAATGAMVLVVTPWLVYNWAEYGHPVLTDQGGIALWYRVFDQDKLAIPTDTADGRLAARLQQRYLEGRNLPPGFQPDPASLQVTESYTYVLGALVRRGDSVYDASYTEGKLALEAILDHPGEYTRGTYSNVKQFAAFNHDLSAAKSLTSPAVDTADGFMPGGLTTVPWRVASLLSNLGWIASLALLAIPLLLFVGPVRSRAAAATLVLVWLATAISVSMTAYPEPRYAAQTAVLQWLLEAAAAVLVISAIVVSLRSSQPDQAPK